MMMSPLCMYVAAATDKAPLSVITSMSDGLAVVSDAGVYVMGRDGGGSARAAAEVGYV